MLSGGGGEVSLSALKRNYEENPQDIDNVLNLVHRYESLGRYGDALNLCRSAMTFHSRAYGFLLAFANVLYKRGDVREARMVFKRLSEIKPDKIEAWNNLGILELSSGNLEEAHAAFSGVLRLDPQNAGALCNMGNYFAEKGDAAVAAAYFERAIGAKPDFIEAWYNRGNAYMALGRFDDAKNAFEQSIEYGAAFGSVHKNLGFVLEQLNDYDRALESYVKAAALNKDDAGVQSNMAGVYMRKGRYGKALECGRRAARLAPTESSSWNALRRAALRLGDGQSYYRTVTALINSIGDEDLAESIRDLREMGFGQEADDLLEYSVKINKKSALIDSLPFSESVAPKIESGGVNQRMFKFFRKKNADKQMEHKVN